MTRGWTRRRLLGAAAGGGAVVAGGAAIGSSFAAPSEDTDARILNVFLLLERVQEAFYRAAVESGRLDGELLKLAAAVGEQETRHVAFLLRRLGGAAESPPRSDFEDALRTPERFREAAVELEEAALAAYIGQSANLTRGEVTDIATLVSVEARQVAWLRDLAGMPPAPEAADPGRRAEDVIAEMRARGYVA